MEKKEKLLEKLNIKDYTKRLEKILEKKKFSLDTKNLLLSMLYKIENAYNDYEKTKVQAPSKNEFIERIFSYIQENCDEIIVAEFNSESSKVLKENQVQYIIEKASKKFTAYGNELLVLNCILKMSEKQICTPDEKQILQVPVSYLLNLGDRMNKLEVIRDFNGWSWDVVLKEVEDIEANFIFQNVLFLMGYDFVNEWINNESKLADYIELLEAYIRENFGEKRAKDFVTLFCKLAVEITISQNKEQFEFWKETKEKAEKEFEKLSNKEKFLEEITKEKKNYTKQIEEIDKIINNKELLKDEYIKRNAKLPNKEKIFSISHFVDKLNKERDELLDKIKESNKIIEPKGYVARKEEVEKKLEFLKQIDIKQKQDKRKSLVELGSIFLECFQIKVAKAKTKQEIVSYIYELRYLRIFAI